MKSKLFVAIHGKTEKQIKDEGLNRILFNEYILKEDHEAFVRKLLDLLTKQMPYRGMIKEEEPLNELYWKLRNHLERCERNKNE